jgi:hypothetical protein
MSDNLNIIKPILLKFHEKLKDVSLWRFSEGVRSPSHDIGMEMFKRSIGASSGQGVAIFDKMASASAVQMRVAQMAGLVSNDVGSWVHSINEIPEELCAYFGLNTQRDAKKPMAFGKEDQAGVFESGISSRVVIDPAQLITSAQTYAEDTLEPDEASILVSWWEKTFAQPGISFMNIVAHETPRSDPKISKVSKDWQTHSIAPKTPDPQALKKLKNIKDLINERNFDALKSIGHQGPVVWAQINDDLRLLKAKNNPKLEDIRELLLTSIVAHQGYATQELSKMITANSKYNDLLREAIKLSIIAGSPNGALSNIVCNAKPNRALLEEAIALAEKTGITDREIKILKSCLQPNKSTNQTAKNVMN